MDTSSGETSDMKNPPRRKLKTTSDVDRRRVIKAFEKGATAAAIAKILNMKAPTVYGIIKNYRESSQIESKKRGGNAPKRLSPEAIENIRSWVDEDSSITLKTVAERVFQLHGLRVSTSTVAREITAYKNPEKARNQRGIKLRCDRCAMNHLTEKCPFDDELMDPLICSKCNTLHEANDSGCPKRSEISATSSQSDEETHDHSWPKFSAGGTIATKLEASWPISASQSPTSESAISVTPANLQDSMLEYISEAPSQSSAEENSLHDPETLLKIFKEMSTRLRACRSKADQVSVLGEIIIRYS